MTNLEIKIKLEIEAKELKEKIDKLESFLNSEAYEKLMGVQNYLLQVQLKAMETYHTCLTERIIDLTE